MIPRPPTSTLFPYTTLFRSTGQPIADPYTVRASVRVPNEASKEAYDFAYPHGTVEGEVVGLDRKSTRLNSSHRCISYAVFCLKKKKKITTIRSIAGQECMWS